MNIRRAGPDDARTITVVLMASFDALREQYTYGAYAATVGTTESHTARLHEGPIWLAEIDGDPVGTVSTAIEDRKCYIRGMGVDPRVRGNGVARALLDVCLTDARNHGATIARLHTTQFLHAAISLYESAGFIRVENTDRPDLFGTPLIAFEQEL